MKKRFAVAAAVAGSLLVIAVVVGKVMGYWQSYHIPNPSNEPGIKVGDHIIASSLKKPVSGSMVVFTNAALDTLSNPADEVIHENRYVFRVCGTPGDNIQMKDGILFVNRKNFDTDFDLYNEYKIPEQENGIIEQEDVYANKFIDQLAGTGDDSSIVIFNKALLNKYQSKLHPVPCLVKKSIYPPFVFGWHDKGFNWTADNFGPVKVPAGSFFVLGDNRHNALDSRYFGFVTQKDIIGVVVCKY